MDYIETSQDVGNHYRVPEMGGQQSTRRVTIVSEEASGVIKVGFEFELFSMKPLALRVVIGPFVSSETLAPTSKACLGLLSCLSGPCSFSVGSF